MRAEPPTRCARGSSACVEREGKARLMTGSSIEDRSDTEGGDRTHTDKRCHNIRMNCNCPVWSNRHQGAGSAVCRRYVMRGDQVREGGGSGVYSPWGGKDQAL